MLVLDGVVVVGVVVESDVVGVLGCLMGQC